METDELKVLQTLLQLITTDTVVVQGSLSRSLSLCISLTFHKEPVIANTAEATVKQIVNTIFDRIEDIEPTPDTPANVFLNDGETFIRELCSNITNEGSASGSRASAEVPQNFGVEILENILQIYYKKILICPKLLSVVKVNVCQLVLKLISPTAKLKVCVQLDRVMLLTLVILLCR